jgi:hypothetical protein
LIFHIAVEVESFSFWDFISHVRYWILTFWVFCIWLIDYHLDK